MEDDLTTDVGLAIANARVGHGPAGPAVTDVDLGRSE